MKTSFYSIAIISLLLSVSRASAEEIDFRAIAEAIENRDLRTVINLASIAILSDKEQDMLIKKADQEAKAYDKQAFLSYETKKGGLQLTGVMSILFGSLLAAKLQLEGHRLVVLPLGAMLIALAGTLMFMNPQYHFHQPQAILDYLKNNLPAYANPIPERQVLKDTLCGAALTEEEAFLRFD